MRLGWHTTALAIAAAAASLAAAARADVALTADKSQVGRFEKAEFRITLDRTYGNPFDPAEVDVGLLLTAPSGAKLSLPAFYSQDYERKDLARGGKPAAWLYPSGPPGWKARFAPWELGTYEAVAVVADRQGTQRSAAVRLECRPSARKGFVRRAADNPRYLELSTGEPLLAIGQNLAFIGEGQYVTLPRAEQIFRSLGENGANFLRVWTCCEDWAIALEARKSAWGRSWNYRPPLVPVAAGAADRSPPLCVKIEGEAGKSLAVSPSHPVALRPDTQYTLSGEVKSDGKATLVIHIAGKHTEPLASKTDGAWTPFAYALRTTAGQYWLDSCSLQLDAAGTVLLKDLSLKEAGKAAPELLWEADPNRPLPGTYNLLDCAMLDQLVDAADANGIYLQLCVVTRDLYMKRLKDPQSAEYDQAIADAKKLMRYCVARWGYSTQVAAWEYFNEIDPGLPTDRFYAEVGEYLEQADIYHHLRTTSTWHPSAKDCRHPQLDIAEVHHYLRPGTGEPSRDEVAAVMKLAQFLRENGPDKPGLIAEFGLADDKWGLSPYMKQDAALVHFHNALWASAMSGCAGTTLFWWWETLDQQKAYPHYRPLSRFVADVPWNRSPLQPAVVKIATDKVRGLGLQSAAGVDLWLFDSAATWGSQVIEHKQPAEIKDFEITVTVPKAGPWEAQWWDTRSGEVQRVSTTSNDGSLRLHVPAFRGDIGLKIRPAK